MTIMSPEEYTHYKPAKAFFLFGCAVTGFLASVGLMRAFWVPPTPFVRREFPGGLEKELGGPNAISVSYLFILPGHIVSVFANRNGRIGPSGTSRYTLNRFSA